MFLRSSENTYYIQDHEASLSPLLEGKEDHYSLWIPLSDEKVYEYVKFLRGEDFTLHEDIFKDMKHKNDFELPNHAWKMKLQEYWVKRNIDRIEDPYRGLTEIPKEKNIEDDLLHTEVNVLRRALDRGFYLAGGAALYMAGYQDDFNDLDLFTTNSPREAERVIREILGVEDLWMKMVITRRSITVKAQFDYHQWPKEPTNIQFILRSYRYPTEIIHGFDIDCCCVLYDGEKLWATNRALHAISYGENWLDPDLASPSYIPRLIKYKSRGFNIRLPLTHKYMDEEHGEMLRSISDLITERITSIFRKNGTIIFENNGSRINAEYKKINSMLPNGTVSTILLASFNISLNKRYMKESPYSQTVRYVNRIEEIRDIEWKVQNPGSQVLATLDYEPITDYETWIKRSPLLKKEYLVELCDSLRV